MAQTTPILHVVRPAGSELEEHLVLLTSGLAQRRADVVVVGPLERPLRDALSRGGVRWANVPLAESAAGRAGKEAARVLGRLVQSTGARVVHAHGWVAAALAVRALEGGPGVPLVISPHGAPPEATGALLARLAADRQWRRVLERSQAAVVASQAEARELRTLWRRVDADAGSAVEGRLVVIPPGVEPRRRSSVFDVGVKRRRLGLHQDASVVVTVADLEPGAPVDAFLRVAALVVERLPNVEFAVIGAGPRLAELQALAHTLRLSGSTVFLGKRPDSLDIVGCCNVLAALGGGPWSAATALQALSRDLRVVAGDTPELREVFEGRQSVPLVPLEDTEAFATALCRQLEGLTVDEGSLEATTGMAWGMSEVLASQDEFDLDTPGLDARDRSLDAASDREQLLNEYSLGRMLRRYAELYRRLLGEPEANGPAGAQEG
jgi:glycosyltransferase involved in cell wall biosynthesis